MKISRLQLNPEVGREFISADFALWPVCAQNSWVMSFLDGFALAYFYPFMAKDENDIVFFSTVFEVLFLTVR